MGGSVRVWDLSAHDSGASLGLVEGGKRQHSHIVKEIVVFPDGSKAVSCSYDKTAKVWCLRTGRCLVTLKGHGSNVNECCIFPDDKKILTGSKDGTIKVWCWEKVVEKSSDDGPLGECQLTPGSEQHQGADKEIRGCGIFDGGQKVRQNARFHHRVCFVTASAIARFLTSWVSVCVRACAVVTGLLLLEEQLDLYLPAGARRYSRWQVQACCERRLHQTAGGSPRFGRPVLCFQQRHTDDQCFMGQNVQDLGPRERQMLAHLQG
jgi:hypothetical protein